MELKIPSTYNLMGGPAVPISLGAFVRDHQLGGQEVVLTMGALCIRLYPYSPYQIKQFGERLIELANTEYRKDLL